VAIKGVKLFDTPSSDTKKGRQQQLDIVEEAEFNLQCFLLDYYINFYDADLSESKLSNFDNFIMATGHSNEVVNAFHKRSALEKFVNISPSSLARLYPRIRLFKQQYKKGKKVAEFPIEFDDHIVKKDIEALMLNGGGRPSAAGIKSFSYRNDSTTPANRHVLSCNMKFIFDSFATLCKKQTTKTGNSYQYIDLFSYSGDASGLFEETKKLEEKTEAPGKNDTVNKISTQEQKEQILPETLYQMKAEIGWSFDKTDEFFSGPGRPLAEAIERNYMIMNLTLIDHTITWKQDGVIEVDTEWVAQLETTWNSNWMDIFWVDKEKAFEKAEDHLNDPTIKEKVERLQKLAAEARKKQAETSSTPGIGVFGGILDAKKLDDIQTNAYRQQAITYEKELEELTKNPDIAKLQTDISQRMRQERYQSLINKLLGTGEKRSNTKIRRITLSKDLVTPFEILRKRANRGDAASKEIVAAGGLSALRKDRKKYNALIKGKVKIHVLTAHAAAIDAMAKKATAAIGSKEHAVERVEAQIRSKVDKFIGDVKKGSETFYFVFLGDIIDAAMEVVATNGKVNDCDKMKLIVGPILLGNFQTDLGKTVNLANLPISLDLFLDWWQMKTVRTQATSYPLRQFLSDIVSDLILPAVGADCIYSDILTEPRTTFSILHFPRFKEADSFFNNGDVISLETVEQIQKMYEAMIGGFPGMKDIESFMFIHASNFAEPLGERTRQEDEKRGIYHLRMGADSGLVKELQFSKSNSPQYLKESRYEQSGVSSGFEFANLYSCEARMVGSAWFLPGQMVFVDPTIIGMPSINSSGMREQSTAKKLNIRDYYFVNVVEGVIEDGSYETDLSLIFQSPAQGAGQKVSGKQPTKKRTFVAAEHDEVGSLLDSLPGYKKWKNMGKVDATPPTPGGS